MNSEAVYYESKIGTLDFVLHMLDNYDIETVKKYVKADLETFKNELEKIKGGCDE